jgi:hypothetical protein
MKMKPILLTLAMGIALSASGPQSVTGVITDTMCGAKHSMKKGQPDDDCVHQCVKGSREYALYDGTRVWKLSDQKKPAQFAAKHVKVTGELNEKTQTIKVASIESAE